VVGRLKDLIHRGELHQFTQIDHCDVICQVADHCQVVRDEEVSDLVFHLEFIKEVEDGSLYRHIQRGDRFIGDDDFRMTVSNFNYRAAAQLRSARKVRGNTLVPSKAINIRMPVERAGDFITVLQFSSRPFRVEDVAVSISPEDMVSINYTREGASVRREFLMRAVDTDTLIHYARLER